MSDPEANSEREAERRLRSLLETAGGPAMTREHAGRLREEANEIARRHPSAVVESLRGRVLSTLQPVLIDADRLPGRLRQLYFELETTGPVSAHQLVNSLRQTGLSGDVALDLPEAHRLQVLLWPSLESLLRRYREAVGQSPERLERRLAELEELRLVLPSTLEQPRRHIVEMQTRIRERLGGLERQRELRSWLEFLRLQVEEQQPCAEPNGLDQVLRMATVEAGADGNSVVEEVRRLRANLCRLLELKEELTHLDAAVGDAMAKDRVPVALDEIQRALARATETGLRDDSLVKQAAERLRCHLSDRYLQIERRTKREVQPVLETLQLRLDELVRIGSWLERLARVPGGSDSGLTAAVDSLLGQQQKRLEARMLDREREAVRQLSLQDLPRYIRTLKGYGQLGLEQWTLDLERLQEDVQGLRRIEEDAEQELLTRLEGAASELSAGLMAAEVEEYLADYRQGLLLIAELESAIAKDGLKPAMERKLGELEKLVTQFPSWRRPARVATLLRNARRLSSIDQTLKMPLEREGVQKALGQARELGDEELRSEVQGALRHLLRSFETRNQLAHYSRILANHPQPREQENALSQAIGVVAGFMGSRENEARKQAISRFHEACMGAEDPMLRFLMEQLPTALGNWLDLNVAAARDGDQLNRLELLFDSWLQALPDDLGFHRPKAVTAFARRRCELEVAALEDCERYEEAVQCLFAAQEHFPAPELRVLEAKLSRRAAIAHYRQGEDSQMEGVLAACQRFGVDGQLGAILLDEFRATGRYQPLARLASQGDRTLPSEIDAVASWALRFHRDEVSLLIDELSAADPSLVRGWFVALAKTTEAIPTARLLQILVGFGPIDGERKQWVWELSTSLGKKLETWCAQQVESLDAIETPAHQQAAELGESEEMDDAILFRTLQDEFSQSQSDLEQALESTQELFDELAAIMAPLRRVARIPPFLKVLHQRADSLLGRSRRSKELLHRLERSFEIAVTGSPSPGAWRSLATILRDSTLEGFSSLDSLRCLILYYLRDYSEIFAIVRELVVAHQRGGDGLTPSSLASSRRRLESELGYDGALGQDRFRLARYYSTDLRTFLEQLSIKVYEISEVERYRQRLEAGRHQILKLEERLKRHDAEITAEGRLQEISEIAGLLDQPLTADQSLRQVFAQVPCVGHSDHAEEQLADLQTTSWYQDLVRVEQLLQTAQSQSREDSVQDSRE